MKGLKEYFEEKYLKNTCFSTLDELLNDKTLVEVNAPRALIAVELVGIWKGLNDKRFEHTEGIKEILEKTQDNLSSIIALGKHQRFLKIYNQLKSSILQKDKELIFKILLRVDEFEKDIKEFQNFGVKSKVIIRLNQLRKEIAMFGDGYK